MLVHRCADEIDADFRRLIAVGETVSSGILDARAERDNWEPHQVAIMLRGAIAKGEIVTSQHKTLTLYRRSH